VLSCICGLATLSLLGGSGACALPPHLLRAPLLRDGLSVVPAAGGLCPLARLDGAGYHLSHTVWGYGPWQPFADCGCTMVAVRFPVRGAVTHPCCDPEEVILPLWGGGLRRFNAFQRLPCPLWWVPVGGPLRGQSRDRHGDFCGLVAHARIHRSKG
jgi:hypothetical protein